MRGKPHGRFREQLRNEHSNGHAGNIIPKFSLLCVGICCEKINRDDNVSRPSAN